MDGKSRPRLASGPDIGKTISYLLVICISGMAIKAPISPQGVIIIVDKSRERESTGTTEEKKKKKIVSQLFISIGGGFVDMNREVYHISHAQHIQKVVESMWCLTSKQMNWIPY